MDKKRILLIDDEETFTRTMKSYLDRTGCYEVRVENSGRQGLAAAKVFRPDLILLDVIMPDQDGSALAQELALDPQTKHIPVIFLTAVLSREEAKAHEGMIAGQLFMAKPVSGKEILEHLDRYLGGPVAKGG
ncbi:MAG: response regulator [Candidatus Omnitrophica bacterium]|nr:response regulator [Candidatus Omnitrophota bacterium]MBI3010572.1 response regulator [Candidatus Omnitrophota bacterium]